jgi:uncharacterized SAM-binding protein YcdF (DUF218 family)
MKMSFIVSKLVSWFLNPSNILLLLTLLCLPSRRFWRLRSIGCLSLVALALIAFLPAGTILLQPLEDRFPRPSSLPEKIDGIIVLGGAVRPSLALARNEASTNSHAERLAAGLMLARRFPDAELVYTGGSASLVAGAPLEVDVARRWYAEAGLPEGRLKLEDQSRTTWENAVYTKRMVNPRSGEHWLLVTSAAHMPRAMAAFRAIQWEVTPWPVDYETGADIDFYLPVVSDNLTSMDLAFHEWVGLLYYRLTGRTHELLPSPLHE